MIDDEQAERVIHAAMDLTVAMRDDIDAVEDLVRAVLDAADGNPYVAVAVTAALIQDDRHINPWWQGPGCADPGHDTVHQHRRAGESLCRNCRRWATAYELTRAARARQRKRDAA